LRAQNAKKRNEICFQTPVTIPCHTPLHSAARFQEHKCFSAECQEPAPLLPAEQYGSDSDRQPPMSAVDGLTPRAYTGTASEERLSTAGNGAAQSLHAGQRSDSCVRKTPLGASIPTSSPGVRPPTIRRLRSPKQFRPGNDYPRG